MAGNSFKKVKLGDPVRIGANLMNGMIDAVKLAKRGVSDSHEVRDDHRSSGIILVKNASGADRDRFDVLGLNGPLFGPGANLPEFKNRLVLIGDVPDEDFHCGKFAILLAPIKDGQIVKALACGLVACRLMVSPTDPAALTYLYADIQDGDAKQLHATAIGSAHIIWKEGGTGQQGAVVRISNPSGDIPIELRPARPCHRRVRHPTIQRSAVS